MDWEQAQGLGQQIQIAIADGMTNGFATQAEAQDRRDRTEEITIRDFFAGCALMGIIANGSEIRDTHLDREGLSFWIADEMIKQRGTGV